MQRSQSLVSSEDEDEHCLLSPMKTNFLKVDEKRWMTGM